MTERADAGQVGTGGGGEVGQTSGPGKRHTSTTPLTDLH